MRHISILFTFVVLLLAITACGSRSDDGTCLPAATTDAGVDSGDDVIITPPDCSQWEGDRTIPDLDAVAHLGLSVSHAIVEGTLSDPRQVGDEQFAKLTISRVYQGYWFLQGATVWVAVDEKTLDLYQLPAQMVVGFRHNLLPMDHETLGEPVWWGSITFIPSARTELGKVGLISSQFENMVVATLISRNEEQATFRVDEVLKGQVPTTFQTYWSLSAYQVTWPEPSDQQYLLALHELSDISGTATAAIGDMRPLTAANRQLYEEELTAPRTYWDLARTEHLRREFSTGWSVFRAPNVVRTRVAGIAGECCTGAGGTFIHHEIESSWRKSDPAEELVMGGHAYYGPEVCGDTYIMAADTLGDMSGLEMSQFTCEGTGWLDASDVPQGFHPERLTVLPDDPQTRDDTTRWVGSEGPLLTILDPTASPDPDALMTPGTEAHWAHAVPPDAALIAATHPTVIHITNVVNHTDPPWSEVTISTSYYDAEYDSSVMHEASLAFTCADQRLTTVGSEWYVFIVFDPSWYPGSEAPPYGKGFIIPGLLLPNTYWIRNIISAAQSDYWSWR